MSELGVTPAAAGLVASDVESGSVIGGAEAMRARLFPVGSPRKTGPVRRAPLSWS